jgi:hypothetical protein
MKRRYWILLAAAIVAAIAIYAWDAWICEQFFPESPDDGTASSTNLARDFRLMWETTRLRGQHDPSHGVNPRASSSRAINAASRVFNSINLVGLSREEVIEQIGDPKTSNESIYNFPFWPAQGGRMVYRFDTGSYGWQFNLIFDDEGKVKKVERLWIH